MLNWDEGKRQVDRALELNILEKFLTFGFDNARVYKERIKRIHDKHIQISMLKASDQVLLYNSRLRWFPEKLKSK